MVSFAFFVFVRHTAHCFLLVVSCMLYSVAILVFLKLNLVYFSIVWFIFLRFGL